MEANDTSTAAQDGGMTLRKAWAIYAASLLVIAGLASLEWVGAVIGTYLALGFVMTRIVMGGLIEWHPVYNTLANVFSAKVGMFFLWPIRMFILLFQISVNRAL